MAIRTQKLDLIKQFNYKMDEGVIMTCSSGVVPLASLRGNNSVHPHKNERILMDNAPKKIYDRLSRRIFFINENFQIRLQY